MVEESRSFHGHHYYVYRCAPSQEHPVMHWKYFPTTISQDRLPDIREARPMYMWQSNTVRYTVVTDICVNY
jgi:hypothetical protein